MARLAKYAPAVPSSRAGGVDPAPPTTLSETSGQEALGFVFTDLLIEFFYFFRIKLGCGNNFIK